MAVLMVVIASWLSYWVFSLGHGLQDRLKDDTGGVVNMCASCVGNVALGHLIARDRLHACTASNVPDAAWQTICL